MTTEAIALHPMTDGKSPFPTPEALIAQVRAIAEERPDFVYADQPGAAGECSYVGATAGSEGGEGCLIGQGLVRLGVSPEWLREQEADGAFTVSEMPHLQGSGIRWLRLAQSEQDKGESWGEAVARTDERLRVGGEGL